MSASAAASSSPEALFKGVFGARRLSKDTAVSPSSAPRPRVSASPVAPVPAGCISATIGPGELCLAPLAGSGEGDAFLWLASGAERLCSFTPREWKRQSAACTRRLALAACGRMVDGRPQVLFGEEILHAARASASGRWLLFSPSFSAIHVGQGLPEEPLFLAVGSWTASSLSWEPERSWREIMAALA